MKIRCSLSRWFFAKIYAIVVVTNYGSTFLEARLKNKGLFQLQTGSWKVVRSFMPQAISCLYEPRFACMNKTWLGESIFDLKEVEDGSVIKSFRLTRFLRNFAWIMHLETLAHFHAYRQGHFIRIYDHLFQPLSEEIWQPADSLKGKLWTSQERFILRGSLRSIMLKLFSF